MVKNALLDKNIGKNHGRSSMPLPGLKKIPRKPTYLDQVDESTYRTNEKEKENLEPNDNFIKDF